jgi:mannosyltransferase OCH1-like enzyme
MEIEKNPDFKISDEEDEYNNILDQYELNHTLIDWENVIFQAWKDHNKNLLQLVIFRVRYLLSTTGIYFTIVFLPVIGYFIAIFLLID